MKANRFALYPVLFSSITVLTACNLSSEEEHDHSLHEHEEEKVSTVCAASAREVTTSDARSLCISLAAFKADAPFTAGFYAPGKVTQTVFVSDSHGEPVQVGADGEVITAVMQYPMMYMSSGHAHSTAHDHEADAANAEYGVYNFDVYYPMASVMMDGTTMGRWEYRVKLMDNNGTPENVDDDVTHTVTFEPEVKMYMGSNAFRAVGKNEKDMFKNAMDLASMRQYSIWLESVSEIVEGSANVTLHVTTQNVHHMEGGMDSSDMGGMSGHHNMTGGEDKTRYPGVHMPMNMMGAMMETMLHGEDGTTKVDIANLSVEVSADNGTSWTSLTGGMTHDTLSRYSGAVPMTEGAVELLVRITVNDNVMTKTGMMVDGTDPEDLPVLKFSAVNAAVL